MDQKSDKEIHHLTNNLGNEMWQRLANQEEILHNLSSVVDTIQKTYQVLKEV